MIPFPKDAPVRARIPRRVPIPTSCSNGATNAPGNPDLNSHGKPDLNWLFFPRGSGLGVWQTPSFLQRTQPKPAMDAPPRVLHRGMIRDNEQVLLITEERKWLGGIWSLHPATGIWPEAAQDPWSSRQSQEKAPGQCQPRSGRWIGSDSLECCGCDCTSAEPGLPGGNLTHPCIPAQEGRSSRKEPGV